MNNKQLNILVTGCGGDIGQSIGKILKSNPFSASIIGTDVHDNHAGLFIFDKCFIVSSCNSDSYVEEIRNLVKKDNIDIVIPASEPELRAIADKRIDISAWNVPVVYASEKALHIGFDKLLTANFLKENNMPYPETEIASHISNPNLPLIIKSRAGSGSRFIFKATEKMDFDYYSKKYPDYVAQSYLDWDNEEYTCGVFRSKNKEIRTIIFKRKLHGGYTGFGIISDNIQIKDLLYNIAESIDLCGSINVQLRLTEKGPSVFEINPRFSSTVYFRHLFGFQDVIWSIEDILANEISGYLPATVGKKFYKGYIEYVE